MQKTVSKIGTYDMSGNVREWVWDWQSDYESTSVTDSKGGLSGVARVIRGGSFNFSGDELDFRFGCSVP